MDLLDKMATYVRVVEARSFSAAARQLRISAAAVSRQIATLETELGTPLLLRSTRRMSITDAGQRYYERCLGILRDVDDAQAIGRTATVAGLLKISAPVTFGLSTVVPEVRALMAKLPDLRVDLRLEDRFIDLALDGVDVAIRLGIAPPVTTEVVAHRLMAFRRVMIAAPSYLKRHGTPTTVDGLARHAVLSHAIDSGTWRLVRDGRTQHVLLHPVFRCNAGHAILDQVLAGAGIAMLPDWFVAPHVAAKRLRIVLPGWTSELVPVHVLHRTAQRGELRVRALLEHLRAAWPAER